MKEMIRCGCILMVICAVAAGLLAGANALTKNRILAQAYAEENASLQQVLPEAASFEAVMVDGQLRYYKALDKNGALVGVAFKAVRKGYSSQIETMAGMLLDGTITAIKVVSQNETPGLGTRVTESSFVAQFEKRKLRDMQGVQAITGATISSRAVIASVREKAEEIILQLKNE